MLHSKRKIGAAQKEKFGAAEQRENLVQRAQEKFGAAQYLVQREEEKVGVNQKRQLPVVQS